MILGKVPGPAVGWNTKQEIEAEVWIENRAAAWCSGLTRHQAYSGKMNSRLHTLVLIPALMQSLGRVVSIIGQGSWYCVAGKAGISGGTLWCP